MSTVSSSNKRIAKNTIMLYFRMILVMVVSLYTSRVILNQLGVVDFGIYNIVGGVVMMFSFLNSSMTSATQRFLNFEMGKGDKSKIKQVFSTSLNIHIILGIVIILLAETIGLWFFNNKLVLPIERKPTAFWVYQFSILTFFVNIIQVPYNAAIVAHERMSVYAYISIIEVLLKLFVVFLISFFNNDKLLVYVILIFIIQFLIRLIYQIYCRIQFDECKFRLCWNSQLFMQMFSFAGWNILGSIAWLLRSQGLNILLNLFFGPIINAAQGIASQVNSAISNFVSNFQAALNPQITKNYALNKIEEMETLAYRGVKYSMLLILFLALPIILNIDFILKIWLGSVPEYTNMFVILMVVELYLASMFGNPFMTSLAATGNIRNYQIIVSVILLFILPSSYLCLLINGNPYSVFIVSIIITVVAGIVRFTFCVRQIGFSLKRYVKYVVIPIILVTFLSIPLPYGITQYLDMGWFRLIATILISSIMVFILSWIVLFTKRERYILINLIKSKIRGKNDFNMS